MPSPISSRNHDVARRVKRLYRRTYRQKDGVFLVEGFNLVREGLDSGALLRELVYVETRAEEAAFLLKGRGVRVQTNVVSSELMGWLSDVVTSQGILGVFEQPHLAADGLPTVDGGLLLVADQVRDPGNMGSLLRIADAVGADGFVMTSGCVDVYNPKVVRSAAGAHFRVPLAPGTEIAELRESLGDGMVMLGLDPRGNRSYLEVDYRGPVALVVGNEAFGIGEEDRGRLDDTVFIPMPGSAESLNVASAAAIVMFEALRQRAECC
ncbi:MAG: RNA methyltransferase [Actinobacteria bacterium]|nr:RNA methyltransferase [Actinomycetota bacterium]MBU1943876.1 RNA methyltransferase [Actinomycetota bacterium]MBU2688602.1 RNA methyltransferase [Actinomycetota bacterium]